MWSNPGIPLLDTYFKELEPEAKQKRNMNAQSRSPQGNQEIDAAGMPMDGK